MRNNRSRVTRRSGRPLRPMDWVASSFACEDEGLVGPCNSAAIYAIPPSLLINDFTDPTLMTSLLDIGCGVTTGNSGTYVGKFYFGLIAWDDINDVVPADFPDPFNDSYLDWIGIGALTFSQGASGQGEVGFTTSERGDGFVQWNSKRRLGNQKGILLSVYNNSTQLLSWKYLYRALIKE